jgi:transcriptional regulator with XRE-family HTH domain
MDLVLKLRELRQYRGLSQADAARKSGLGVKTLSSFETGERIDSMKLTQLQRLLRVYGVTESEFFSAAIEHLLAPWEHEATEEIDALVCALRSLPPTTQQVITDKLRLAIDLARDLAPTRQRRQQSGGRQTAALHAV